MSSGKYMTGISTFKNSLDAMCRDHVTKSGELVAVIELSPNKYEEGFYDVKVKNLYKHSRGKLSIIEDKIKGVIYKCLKLKEPMEYAVIRYSNNSISIDEELTSKVIVEERVGKYGSFKVMYLRCEFSDFETL